jgi:hypothetical protein
MKKRYFIFGAALCSVIGLGLTSCNNEEYLDVTHYSMIDAEEMFDNDANAIKGMTGCYDEVLPRENDDVYKYWIFNGSHPTMDSQASGWDKDFMTQKWTASQAQLKTFWNQSYTCISRCNDFLAGLENAEKISANVKKHLSGEAMALRGFEFFGLANTFGRVPLLTTGETYLTNPTKPKAKETTQPKTTETAQPAASETAQPKAKPAAQPQREESSQPAAAPAAPASSGEKSVSLDQLMKMSEKKSESSNP